jgi:hypothetical protein
MDMQCCKECTYLCGVKDIWGKEMIECLFKIIGSEIFGGLDQSIEERAKGCHGIIFGCGVRHERRM